MTELEKIVKRSQKPAESTTDVYQRRVKEFVDFVGNRPEDWTPIAVEDWRDHLLKTIKPKTVNLYLAAVKYASRRYAALHRDPQLDFASLAETVRVVADLHPKKYALTIDQCRALLARAKHEEHFTGRDPLSFLKFDGLHYTRNFGPDDHRLRGRELTDDLDAFGKQTRLDASGFDDARRRALRRLQCTRVAAHRQQRN